MLIFTSIIPNQSTQIHFQGVSCTHCSSLSNQLLHTCHKFKCKRLFSEALNYLS